MSKLWTYYTEDRSEYTIKTKEASDIIRMHNTAISEAAQYLSAYVKHHINVIKYELEKSGDVDKCFYYTLQVTSFEEDCLSKIDKYVELIIFKLIKNYSPMVDNCSISSFSCMEFMEYLSIFGKFIGDTKYFKYLYPESMLNNVFSNYKWHPHVQEGDELIYPAQHHFKSSNSNGIDTEYLGGSRFTFFQSIQNQNISSGMDLYETNKISEVKLQEDTNIPVSSILDAGVKNFGEYIEAKENRHFPSVISDIASKHNLFSRALPSRVAKQSYIDSVVSISEGYKLYKKSLMFTDVDRLSMKMDGKNDRGFRIEYALKNLHILNKEPSIISLKNNNIDTFSENLSWLSTTSYYNELLSALPTNILLSEWLKKVSYTTRKDKYLVRDHLNFKYKNYKSLIKNDYDSDSESTCDEKSSAEEFYEELLFFINCLELEAKQINDDIMYLQESIKKSIYRFSQLDRNRFSFAKYGDPQLSRIRAKISESQKEILQFRLGIDYLSRMDNVLSTKDCSRVSNEFNKIEQNINDLFNEYYNFIKINNCSQFEDIRDSYLGEQQYRINKSRLS